MFIGHFSVALAAAAHPKAPRLGVLIGASQLVDIGFFTLMIAGVRCTGGDGASWSTPSIR